MQLSGIELFDKARTIQKRKNTYAAASLLVKAGISWEFAMIALVGSNKTKYYPDRILSDGTRN